MNEDAQRMVEDLTRMTDRIATDTMAEFADEPRDANGRILNPYWRGVADGVTAVSSGLAAGFRLAFEQIQDQT